jgi:hypothetical protein
VLHTRLGQTDTAAEVLQTLIDVAVDEECLLLVPEATARLIALEAATDLAAAKAHFELLDWAVAGESGLPREGSLRLLARAAIRAAVGDYDGAVSAASNAAGAAEQRGLELLAASAHEVRADNLNRAGRSSEARLALAAAARCYRACGVVPPPRQPWHNAAAEPVGSTAQRPTTISPHVS